MTMIYKHIFISYPNDDKLLTEMFLTVMFWQMHKLAAISQALI